MSIRNRGQYSDVKPPSGAEINWGHPLAQGMVGCWLFNEGVSKWSKELVTGIRKSFVFGTGEGYTKTTKGMVVRLDQGVASGLKFGKNALLNDVPSLTVCVRAYAYNLGGGDGGRLVTKDSNESTGYWGLYYVTGNVLRFVKTCSGTDIQRNSAAITLNKWYDFFVTWDGTVTTSTGVHIYKDNGLLIDGSSTDGTGTLDSDAALSLWIGGNDNQYRVMDGFIGHVYIWNRVIRVAEMRALYEAPYQFIQAPRRRVYSISGDTTTTTSTTTTSTTTTTTTTSTTTTTTTTSTTTTTTTTSTTTTTTTTSTTTTTTTTSTTTTTTTTSTTTTSTTTSTTTTTTTTSTTTTTTSTTTSTTTTTTTTSTTTTTTTTSTTTTTTTTSTTTTTTTTSTTTTTTTTSTTTTTTTSTTTTTTTTAAPNTYIVYQNSRLEVWVDGVEVARFNADGSLDVNAGVTENAF